jgi:hypothetical protein
MVRTSSSPSPILKTVGMVDQNKTASPANKYDCFERSTGNINITYSALYVLPPAP